MSYRPVKADDLRLMKQVICSPKVQEDRWMAAPRLSRLQRRMLQWVYAEESSRGWRYRPGYGELQRALGGNKGNMSVSLRNLEAKGLLQVYRTSGGQASTVWLIEAGKNRASLLKKVLIKN